MTSGMNPAPIPWIMLPGPGSPPESTGLTSGSTATIRSVGFRSLRTCPHPVRVPPVPTPDTTTSTSPPVSFQISSAVVRRCTSGLAGFTNWPAVTAPGISARSFSASVKAPLIPSSLGVRCTSAPRRASIFRRSTDIVSGMVRTHRYPRAAHTMARAMPVFPDVGSTTVTPSWRRPSRSRPSIMARPMRSFTLAAGLKNSSLSRTSARAPWRWESLGARTSGVSPMVSRMLSYTRPRPGRDGIWDVMRSPRQDGR